MIPTVILAAIQLGSAILAALPEPDPKVRRLRALHRQRMIELHAQHQEELAAARLGRRM